MFCQLPLSFQWMKINTKVDMANVASTSRKYSTSLSLTTLDLTHWDMIHMVSIGLYGKDS